MVESTYSATLKRKVLRPQEAQLRELIDLLWRSVQEQRQKYIAGKVSHWDEMVAYEKKIAAERQGLDGDGYYIARVEQSQERRDSVYIEAVSESEMTCSVDYTDGHSEHHRGPVDEVFPTIDFNRAEEVRFNILRVPKAPRVVLTISKRFALEISIESSDKSWVQSLTAQSERMIDSVLPWWAWLSSREANIARFLLGTLIVVVAWVMLVTRANWGGGVWFISVGAVVFFATWPFTFFRPFRVGDRPAPVLYLKNALAGILWAVVSGVISVFIAKWLNWV